MVIQAFCYFGGAAYDDLTDNSTHWEHNPNKFWQGSSEGSLFMYFLEVNNTTGMLNGTTNATRVTTYTDWSVGGLAMVVLDASGISNIAYPIFAFLDLLLSFIFAPLTMMNIMGLNTPANFYIGYVFTMPLVLAQLFAMWQIVTGRNV